MRTLLTNIFVLFGAISLIQTAKADKTYKIASPDGSLEVVVNVGSQISYSLSKNSVKLIDPSAISMQLADGGEWGVNPRLSSAKQSSHRGTIAAAFYKKNTVTDDYNSLNLQFKGYGVQFKVFDEGMAYRFVSNTKKEVTIKGEKAQFEFAKDWKILCSYVRESGNFERQYWNSFENIHVNSKLSELKKDQLVFLPILVEADNGMKISITEADLRNYPGMYVLGQGNKSLLSHYATYPKTEKNGGHNNLEEIVLERENYITKAQPMAEFPWRVVSVSTEDKQLLENDMVYRLAPASKISDISWIKPGKVAWDWWNDFGVYNVDFKSGVNTPTYKAYIDFASKKGIEYVILDEGWAVNKKADLFQIVPEIDLKEIIEYASKKNVGIILWAGCYAFDRDMEKVCKHYSEMGVKGFKVDFMNRDDAKMVEFHNRAAELGAKYHLMMDFHGTYKPTGLNRTYPNVINFEGVNGQEQCKWSTIEKFDQCQYNTEIPFLRMLAGQMDYTQGAMLNGNKKTYRSNYSEPMSQGTRCQQLGEYVVFFSPLNMLCDSPTHYEKESECTDFIAQIPTVWDETVALDSKVGEYVVMARRKGNTWYVGGITNWTERTITLEIPFLKGKTKKAVAFVDGVNANKFAQDYKKKELEIKDGKVEIHMASGGGFAMVIE